MGNIINFNLKLATRDDTERYTYVYKINYLSLIKLNL